MTDAAHIVEYSDGHLIRMAYDAVYVCVVILFLIN